MRFVGLAGLAVLLPGCGDAPDEARDAAMRIDAPGVVQSCGEVAFAPEGTPCIFGDVCTERLGCCVDTSVCEGGVVRRQRECEEPCLRSCGDAFERGREGEACDGAWVCSSFSEDLCCSVEVACSAGRLGREEDCTPGCR